MARSLVRWNHNKYFRIAGILNANLDVISGDLEGQGYPLLQADMHREVQSITMPTHGHCNVEYCLDDNLPVC